MHSYRQLLQSNPLPKGELTVAAGGRDHATHVVGPTASAQRRFTKPVISPSRCALRAFVKRPRFAGPETVPATLASFADTLGTRRSVCSFRSEPADAAAYAGSRVDLPIAKFPACPARDDRNRGSIAIGFCFDN